MTRDEASIGMDDLRTVLTIQRKVSNALKDAVLFAAEVTIFDESGSYILGTVYYDAESDDWRWDPRGYGKDSPPSSDASTPARIAANPGVQA